MENYKKIRSKMYSVQFDRWSHLINIKSPYTFMKSIYYMETASIFLYLTQGFIKSPNFITFLYAITGLVGSFLLLSYSNILFAIGAFMVFSKGTFDWADGPLARRLNKTSFLGHAIDTYGAHISDSAFRIAFIYYAIRPYSELNFLIPIFSFIILFVDLRVYADFQYLKLLTGISSTKDAKIRNNEFELNVRSENKNSKIKLWYFRYVSILDTRSRTIDSLLFLLILDCIYKYDFKSLFLCIAILIVLRSFIMHIAAIYFSFKTYNKN